MNLNDNFKNSFSAKHVGDTVKGNYFDLGNTVNAPDGVQIYGNEGKNLVTINKDKNYGTTIFTLI